MIYAPTPHIFLFHLILSLLRTHLASLSIHARHTPSSGPFTLLVHLAGNTLSADNLRADSLNFFSSETLSYQKVPTVS